MKRTISYIVSVGSYLPEKVLSNSDLEKIIDTSDEWITTRTGIKERRIAKADEFASDMGAKAARIALEKANLSPEEVDLIIVATLSPDYIFPSTACLIQNSIGATKAAAFDIQAACTGLIYALAVAKSFIESEIYKNILVVGSEKISPFLNYEDRSTCILFGDGATACLVSGNAEKGLSIGKIILGSDGEQADILKVPAGGCRNPASSETVKNKMHFIQMNGQDTFKHAVRRMEEAIVDCLKKENLRESDIAHFVPHQANIRIVKALVKRCNIEHVNVVETLGKYGNTSASSIGIALDHLIDSKKIKTGDRILLAGFGGGLTWGALILTALEGM
jgi:3-oxoacyl-[acyl-carrier-protein] synthase-3